ncbi:MAG: N-acetylmuramoyl-L-alanine amidase [Hungatella sp.]
MSRENRNGWFSTMIVAALSLSLLSGCTAKYEQVETKVVEAEATGAEGEKLQIHIGGGQAESSVHEAVMRSETAPSFQAVDETVYVTGDQVNLRTDCSPSSEIVAKLGKGTALKRSGYSDTWSKVTQEGQNQICYIATQYLSKTKPEAETSAAATTGAGEVKLNADWKYAEFSKINSGAAMLYHSESASRKGITVCVNAGHGTSKGNSVKTQCHPDGTPKVTGGTTGAGTITAIAVSSGMRFADGTAEATVALALARKLKDKLLANGYDVLMIRESEDVLLDNVARTVIANNVANCHIALHWDSTDSNKGAFYMSVPNVTSYRNMEPVKSNWQKHNRLGDNLVGGLKGAGVKIFSGGSMEMDLTQTSYSTIPSVDIELGDKVSDHSSAALDILADGLTAGVKSFFGN